MGFYNKMGLDREQKEFIERMGLEYRRRDIKRRLKKVQEIQKPISSLISGMRVRKGCKPGPGYKKYLDKLYFERKIKRIYFKMFRTSHTNDLSFRGIFGV